MIILSYFNRIIGPVILTTMPKSLKKEMDEDYKKQIKGLLDSNDDGYFTHNFSPEFKTANIIFSLDSSWARGRTELAMVSAIISEDDPDYSVYEDILTRFVDRIKKKQHIFKAFYINNAPKEHSEEIKENYQFLEEELNKIYKILSIKKIETDAQLISYDELKQTQQIGLSQNLLQKIQKLTQEKKNCFMVFRTRGEAMKLDIIPFEKDKVIRLAILFGEQMTVNVLQHISQIFAKFDEDVSLIFTSGICQEVDKCIYEVYIDTDMDTLNQIIEEIYKLKSILEVEVNVISKKGLSDK